MPVIIQSNPSSGTGSPNNSSIKLQDIVDDARSYSELIPVLGASGWSQRPALPIANEIISKVLGQTLDWKWNRGNITPFLTTSLQQDYVTTVTNLGWLEGGWRVDINNSATPQPVFGLETVRDLGRTAFQGSPFNVSWIPNRLAIMGTWKANTSYPSSVGQTSMPVSPIQQFIDVNANILYVTTNGTSGGSQPTAAASSPAGTTVTDGSVIWTVADPNAAAIRLSPLPPNTGLVWQINPIYQFKPPVFTSLQNTIAPIPDDYAYLFRDGFIAKCKIHAGTKDAESAYMKWEESLVIALRAADREREDAGLIPSEGITGGRSFGGVYGAPIGAAWPFDYSGY